MCHFVQSAIMQETVYTAGKPDAVQVGIFMTDEWKQALAHATKAKE